MYKRSMGRQNGNSSDKELIDISSDDDQMKSSSSAIKMDKDYSDTEAQPAKKPHLSMETNMPKAATSSTMVRFR